MTSFPAAAPYAYEALKSLLHGSVLPEKVVLYLTLSQFEDGVPKELLQLEKDYSFFEIRDYPKDIRSYRKLIPVLHDFPDSVIVTVDDDVIYDKDMLKRLLELHEKDPKAVFAHRAKKIIPDLPYKNWRKYRWYHFLHKKLHYNFRNIQTGVGGVLYPPRSLDERFLNVDLFTSLAPTTDDIWFWAAVVSNDRYVVPVPFGQNKPKGLHKPKSISLKTSNFKRGIDNNFRAFTNILNHFPEIKEKIK